MQSGTNKSERYHYSIWYGWHSCMEDFSDSETRNKKIRQQQKLECNKELSNYVYGETICQDQRRL